MPSPSRNIKPLTVLYDTRVRAKSRRHFFTLRGVLFTFRAVVFDCRFDFGVLALPSKSSASSSLPVCQSAAFLALFFQRLAIKMTSFFLLGLSRKQPGHFFFRMSTLRRSSAPLSSRFVTAPPVFE